MLRVLHAPFRTSLYLVLRCSGALSLGSKSRGKGRGSAPTVTVADHVDTLCSVSPYSIAPALSPVSRSPLFCWSEARCFRLHTDLPRCRGFLLLLFCCLLSSSSLHYFCCSRRLCCGRRLLRAPTTPSAALMAWLTPSGSPRMHRCHVFVRSRDSLRMLLLGSAPASSIVTAIDYITTACSYACSLLLYASSR